MLYCFDIILHLVRYSMYNIRLKSVILFFLFIKIECVFVPFIQFDSMLQIVHVFWSTTDSKRAIFLEIIKIQIDYFKQRNVWFISSIV